MYVCMYVCMYVPVCVHVYMYVCAHVCLYKCMVHLQVIPRPIRFASHHASVFMFRRRSLSLSNNSFSGTMPALPPSIVSLGIDNNALVGQLPIPQASVLKMCVYEKDCQWRVPWCSRKRGLARCDVRASFSYMFV
jgi:hypothetical protein